MNTGMALVALAAGAQNAAQVARYSPVLHCPRSPDSAKSNLPALIPHGHVCSKVSGLLKSEKAPLLALDSGVGVELSYLTPSNFETFLHHIYNPTKAKVQSVSQPEWQSGIYE